MCFPSVNDSGTHTGPHATQLITQSSTGLHHSCLALGIPEPIWEPFPRRGRHWVLWQPGAGDMWLVGRSGEETCLLLPPQPPLISHQPKTKYQARGSLGLAKCSCSDLLGKEKKALAAGIKSEVPSEKNFVWEAAQKSCSLEKCLCCLSSCPPEIRKTTFAWFPLAVSVVCSLSDLLRRAASSLGCLVGPGQAGQEVPPAATETLRKN